MSDPFRLNKLWEELANEYNQKLQQEREEHTKCRADLLEEREKHALTRDALIASEALREDTEKELQLEIIFCRGLLKEMENRRYEIAALLKIEESKNNQADSPWWKLTDMLQRKLYRSGEVRVGPPLEFNVNDDLRIDDSKEEK
jgi:hypothetical protein